ncbi:ATP-dependent helicase [Fictibacillus sp. b24]|uniref:ATP-dependent helicase n=1 Tax=Fictibacillus sp. b24 TaxID=3055863 RepID=UPI0025A184CF|nr:ATP-dependent helicase [Fictibacillus sp. b24]MDM5314921.1 ATP-dependent helicase [Fictibacillus sp. b24]
MKDKYLNKLPQGSKTNKIPYSSIINHQTTTQLVGDKENDAHYFRALERSGIYLNEAQLNAVRASHGPHLIIAGAGSGKTRVLTSRAGYLLTFDRSIKPNNIMLVTFTRKAAEEMITRIQSLPGISRKMANDMVSGTFHSIFLRILRNQGFNQKIINSEKYKEILIKGILREQNLLDSYEPETILTSISSYKSNLLRPKDIKTNTPIEREIQSIYEKYELLKNKKDLMDFDDILIESYYTIKDNKVLLNKIQNHIRYIQVDEYQDVNKAQHELIKLIVKKPQENVFFVGDEDQVIYNFRQASPDFILNLEKEYPHLKRITLETNYRSTDSIVGLGNEIIKHNKQRLGKKLKATKTSHVTPFYFRPSETLEEAVRIADNIQADVKLGKRDYKDYAILYRTHNNCRALFDEFVLRDIPFISKNDKVFYKQPIVKPVLDYLRVSLNPNDTNAIEGIAPTLYLNKEKTVQHALEFTLGHTKKNMLRSILNISNLKPFQMRQISERIEFIENLNTRVPADAIREIRMGVPKYDEYLESDSRKTLTLHKELIRETLDELEASASRFTRIEDFLLFVDKIIKKNEQMEELRKKPNANCVQLMTIHSSKGLEYPVVYVIGFSETILPHASALSVNEQQDRTILLNISESELRNVALEEERRLAYVSVTRAQEELYLSSPKLYRNKEVDISSFLLEAFSNYETK